MNISQVGINLIKKYEGLRLTAYKAVPTEKYWTIGYGHYGSDVKQGQIITQAQADAYFLKDIQKFVDGVNRLVKVKLSQSQFDSLVSFSYNCGLGALEKSTLLKLVNSGQFDKAALEFDKWNKSGGKVLKGLVTRRNEEQALFSKTIPPETKVVEKSYFLRTGSMSKSMAEKYAKELHEKYGWVIHIGEV